MKPLNATFGALQARCCDFLLECSARYGFGSCDSSQGSDIGGGVLHLKDPPTRGIYWVFGCPSSVPRARQ